MQQELFGMVDFAVGSKNTDLSSVMDFLRKKRVCME